MNAQQLEKLKVNAMALLRARAGLSIKPINSIQISDYLSEKMSAYEVESAAEGLGVLRRDLSLWQGLVAAATVAESYFFRVPAQFQFLERHCKALAEQRHRPKPRLRFWSAGCATGEEPYSLAIMLANMGLLSYSDIIASDLCADVLTSAKRAQYSNWSFRDQGYSLAKSYLLNNAGGFEVKADIRRSVRFMCHNLMELNQDSCPVHFNNMHVILCRNVLIYLAPENVAKVYRCLIACLAPGGVLVVAPSDPIPQNLPVHYRQVEHLGIVLQKPQLELRIGTKTSRSIVPNLRNQYRENGSAFSGEKLDLSAVSVARLEALAVELGSLESALRLLLNDVENNDAITLVEQLLEKATDNVELRYTCALFFTHLKHYERAFEEVRKISYLDPFDAQVHFTCGLIQSRLNRTHSARESYLRSRRIIQSTLPQPAEAKLATNGASTLLAAIDHELFKLNA